MSKLISKTCKISDKLSLHFLNIGDYDDGFRKLIDENISSICNGILGDNDIDIIKIELKRWFDGKDASKKSGFVAEFFFHLYMKQLNFEQHFLFRNLEETNSMKKGFDGVYRFQDEIWLYESKSSLHTTLDATHNSNIGEAFRDINKKLNGSKLDIKKNPIDPWTNAINHANDNETKEEVKERRRLKDQKVINNTNFLISDSSKFTVHEKIERYFIENNIDDFYSDLQYVIPLVEAKIDNFKNDENWKTIDLVTKIYYLFIHKLEDKIKDYEIERLKNPSAQKYYNFYIDKTQKQSLKQNIIMTFDYFKKKAQSSDPFLFIGKSYGDVIRYSDIYNDNKYKDTVYVNLKGKSDEKMINLSIVKLKIEEDFVSFKLNKLIVFLYDFKLISLKEYYN